MNSLIFFVGSLIAKISIKRDWNYLIGTIFSQNLLSSHLIPQCCTSEEPVLFQKWVPRYSGIASNFWNFVWNYIIQTSTYAYFDSGIACILNLFLKIKRENFIFWTAEGISAIMNSILKNLGIEKLSQLVWQIRICFKHKYICITNLIVFLPTKQNDS